MKISEMLKKKERLLSFEFFPPKKAESEHILFETIDTLKHYCPDFTSVTYGAGGSTRDKTIEWSVEIKKHYDINVMMHLTCITSTTQSIDEVTSILKENNIENILALRGDIPDGYHESEMMEEFKYASDLVKFIKGYDSFSIGVAGYPEGHRESVDLEDDIEHLKKKVDMGADFIITQLFFNNEYMYQFIDRCSRHNINIPIIAGIMPIVNQSQVIKFTEMCGVHVPNGLLGKMNGKSENDMFTIGVEYAAEQCNDLLNNGIKGLHFYTLNKSEATKNILDILKL